MASRALSARLRIAVESWPGSTSVGQASSVSCGMMVICSPRVGCNNLAASSVSALTSISRGWSGCLRAKASRCLVSCAPRSAASAISLVMAVSSGRSATGCGRVDELARAVPDHVFRAEAEDVLHTGADLNEIAETIGDQDQILRGLEDALAFLDLAVERRLGPLSLGDVARHLGRADDLAVG